MLINRKIIEERITNYSFVATEEHMRIFKKWEKDTRKEEAIQSDFLNDIFGKVLGYQTETDQDIYHLDKEQKTQKDGTKPDGILGYFSLKLGKKDIRVVIELKDKHSKNLDSVEEQAFRYKDKIENVEWIITSNISQIRLYHSEAGGRLNYESFEMSTLQNDPDEIKKLHFLLAKDRLFTENAKQSVTHTLLNDTKQREKEIENLFYQEYSQVRTILFEDLKKQNSQDHDLLLSKTQKLLDRFIFICFVEKYGILSTKVIERIDDQFDNTLWDSLKALFRSFDKGNTKIPLPAINGGLFRTDSEMDSLLVSDKALKELIKLSKWDFASDLSVNILGHIFEQSISDLERERAKIQQNNYNIKKGKQKKDGIFYTPEYITRYIVNETLGAWILQKRTQLQLHTISQEDIQLAKTKKKKLSNKEQQAKQNIQDNIKKLKQYSEQLKQIKILDPACGSGAFLVQVFEHLESEWNRLRNEIMELYQYLGEQNLFELEWNYKNILQENIYGVDKNLESVHITRLSLWLKTASKKETLTTLDHNIKLGNSLIDDPNIAGTYKDEKGQTQSLAFDWQKQFPKVFPSDKAGFDIIVGNPPYGAELDDSMKEWLDKKFQDYKSQTKNSVIYFMYMTHFSLIKKDGYYSFIIPKSICYSQGWNNVASLLNSFCLKLIDASLAFPNVLLEQVIFISTKDISSSFNKSSLIYGGYTFDNRIIEETNTTRDIFIEHKVLLCGLKENELNLVLKILENNKGKYGDIVKIARGLNWQSQSSNNSSYQPIYRGSHLYKYKLGITNDFVNLNNFNKKQYNYILKPKILNQLAIAHVKNPYPHFYLQSYIDQTGDMFVYETISCTFPKDENTKLLFLLALNNSKLFAWILYKFIYTNSIRSTRFDDMYIKKIPIPKISPEQQEPFVQKAEQMLKLQQELHTQTQSVLNYLNIKFDNPSKLPQKLQTFYTLAPDDFLAEISKLHKQKQSNQRKKVAGKLANSLKTSEKLSKAEEQDWLEYFSEKQSPLQNLQAQINQTDHDIDQMVYQLYKLSPEEIEIVEATSS